MAKKSYFGVDGVSRNVKSWPFGVGGVARNVNSGYFGVGGVARQFFNGELTAGDLAIGSVLKIARFDGTYVDYLVVNQGKPLGSSLYDDSCDGTWLLRKSIDTTKVWYNGGNSVKNNYSISNVNSYLTNFYGNFGAIEQTAIKEIKIPYAKRTGTSWSVLSGADGLSVKVFLLSAKEVGFSNESLFPVDGEKLAYFQEGNTGEAPSLRIAYQDGAATQWWLRTPCITGTKNVARVLDSGIVNNCPTTDSHGVLPAIVIYKNTIIDPDTMQILRVA